MISGGAGCKRSAAGNRRHRVAVVMHLWDDRVFAGIARYSAEHDWELDCRMRWSHAAPAESLRLIDGLVINVGMDHHLKILARSAQRAGVPIVGLQQVGHYPCDTRVLVLDETLGRMAAAHLLDLDLTHLIFVRLTANVMERDRCAGFTSAGREKGREPLMVDFEEFRKRLRALPRPFGVTAATDLGALEVMRACLDEGIQIPEECAIVGIGDSEILCPLAPVPLSSVNANLEMQGYVSAVALNRLIAGELPPESPIIVLPRGVTSRRSTDTLTPRDPNTAKALHFLRTHFCEPVRISEVSDTLGISPRKLQAGFLHDIGHTMMEELTRLRVEQAKQLLEDSHRKLDEIAIECGFTNRFHLTRAFHRATGVSPTEFRTRRGKEFGG